MNIFTFLKKIFFSNLILNFQEVQGRNNENLSQKENKEQQTQEEKQIENNKAGMKYLSSYGNNLMKGLENISKTEKADDPEFQAFVKQVKEKISRLGKEFQELKQENIDILSGLKTFVEENETNFGIEVDNAGNVEKLDFSEEELENIENKDILSLPKEKRLQYVTKQKIDSDRVSSGEIKNLDFTFTFNGKLNNELYFKTTAGQVLPDEVGVVISNGVEYKRSGISGEFFSGNNRLTIREGTNIEITELRTKEELEQILQGFDSQVGNIKNDIQRKITLGALKRNIDSNIVLETFSKILEKTPENERKYKIEDLFTQFERIIGSYDLDKNNPEEVKKYLENDGNGNLKSFNQFVGKIDINNLQLREGDKGLLDLISVFESGGNYNSLYGKGSQTKIKFTDMTISQVLQFQDSYVAKGSASSAVGKYQFIRKTLRACVQATGISLDTKFNEETQDKLGLYLLKLRGLDKFKSGQMSVEQFQLNLSKEWASIPKDSGGKSFYAGDGLNAAHLPHKKIYSYLQNMRKNG
ncbi:hypothetical protein DLH72_03060 [Candidatus Gracilibacteria bacterium]|nr:MAG: hypothetical protein DLH72_03060 [Candidatus Gracilibacteria bacterium]